MYPAKLSPNHTRELPWETPHDGDLGLRIKELTRQRLANVCPHSFYFKDVDVDFADGILRLRGRVSSFYLKQVLQTLLGKIDGVSLIDNQVDVVSATGLSSVRPRATKS